MLKLLLSIGLVLATVGIVAGYVYVAVQHTRAIGGGRQCDVNQFPCCQIPTFPNCDKEIGDDGQDH